MNETEDNSAAVETQGNPPGVLTEAPPPGSETGARAQGSHRNLGDLVTSGASRNGTAERQAERRRGTRSRSAAVGALTSGNLPEGPGRAKGGTGTWNQRRER